MQGKPRMLTQDESLTRTILAALNTQPGIRPAILFGSLAVGRERGGYLCAGTEASPSLPLVTSSTTALPDGIPAAVLPAMLMRHSEFLQWVLESQ